MVRELDTEGLVKFVDHIAKENIMKLSNNAQLENLIEIRTLSKLTQRNIYNICGKISDNLKLLHLKLAEINAINDKIKSIEEGNFKSKHTGAKFQNLKLGKALIKEKLIVTKIMKQIGNKQKSLIKAMSGNDKEFARKNKTQLKNILSSINLQLKPDMKLPYFKKAYGHLISKVLSDAKSLKPEQLNDSIKTATALIAKFWKKILSKEKSEWEKLNKRKSGKKEKKKGKKEKDEEEGKNEKKIKRIE